MSSNGVVYFTPVQKRMLAVLADGMPHSREELHACLDRTDGPLSNIQAHITHIRGKLRPKGHDIVCEMGNRTICYRHVILLQSANDGVT
jgi:hypothetical protein